MVKLTVKEADALTTPGRYAAGDGLYLEIKENGSKAWLFRYQFMGKRTQLGLGSYSKTNTLAIARNKALGMQSLIAKGIDPKQDKDEQKRRFEALQAEQKQEAASKKNTFEKVAHEWWDAKRHEWTNEKHAAQNINTLNTYVFPVIGGRPISEITVQDVLACLKPIWYEKTETASRTRQRIEAVFSYAKTLGYCSGENPAQLKHNIENLLPPAGKLKRKKALDDPNHGHHAAMSYKDVPGFVKQLQTEKALSAQMLIFTILTVSRTEPVLQMEWKHLDLAEAVWSIPGKYMKNKKPFKVPLSPPAVKLLKSIRKISDYVFPSPRDLRSPMSNMVMLNTLSRMGLRSVGENNVTVHGFRTSFRTWSEESGHDQTVAEFVMSHEVGSKVERAYQRSDLFERRRELMKQWAEFISPFTRKNFTDKSLEF